MIKKVYQTKQFSKWIKKLIDKKGKARNLERIWRIKSDSSLGDYKHICDGVFELRIHYGPGYRVYFSFYKETIIFLLIGGNKTSQKRDIAKAKAINKKYRSGNEKDI